MRARRDELGDSAAFCTGCGWGQRFLAGYAGEVAATCPDCGGEVISACPACGHRIASLMAITCAGCGEPLRAPDLFGGPIRRKPERHAIVEAPECAGEAAAAFEAETAR